MTDTWIPLMDYAMKKGVSLSTLRRHIKANRIQYRIENGRYLLLDTGQFTELNVPRLQNQAETAEILRLQAKLRKTSVELQRAQEEIAELKTLIAFYEDTARPSR